jgi:hypothetical protein
MKVIYNSTLQSITLAAGTADANYPITNLQNGHPRVPFRTTGGNTATLTITETGAGGALGIVMTNATSISVSSIVAMVYSWGEGASGATITAGEGPDGNTLAWMNESGAESALSQSIQNFDGQNGIILITFAPQGFTRTINITLKADNDTVLSVGQVVLGQMYSFRDFKHDSYQGSSIDMGTSVPMNDGSDYYKPLRIIRKPSGAVPMYVGADGHDPDGYNTFREFWNMWLSKGKTPMVWSFSDLGLEDNMMAQIDAEPSFVMLGPNYKLVSLQFKERI